ncbi:MAG: hypothetical protein HY897_07935, partial [Deltaproteobacteria bacterium]|nr:hypothetical protein [Deltaproteobacteria bacterium]
MKTALAVFLFEILAVCASVYVGCGMGDDEAADAGAAGAPSAYHPGEDGGGGGYYEVCYYDSDCSYGYYCVDGQCVYQGGGGGGSDAGAGGGYDAGYVDTYVPPEKPVYIPSPPVASKNYVYVLNAQNGTVVRINP